MISNSGTGYNPSVEEIALSDAALHWCEAALAEVSATNAQTAHTAITAEPLRVEASHRSFYRLRVPHDSWVLMTSPPDLERNDAFVSRAEVFARHGVPVPRILAAQHTAGWFLLSDLGSRHLEDTYGTVDEAAAIAAAIALLPRIAQIDEPEIEPYTPARFADELALFNDWFVTGLLGADDLPPAQADYDRLIAATQEQPQGCVHRDYHCRNLLFDRGRLGVVDFQDALRGPLLYDLASLLRDCYYAFSEADVDRHLDAYLGQVTDFRANTRADIRRWFDYTAIQRQLKAIGIFARLWLRDGKSSHLAYIAPLLERLVRLLQRYPELGQLQSQLQDCTIRCAAQPDRFAGS